MYTISMAERRSSFSIQQKETDPRIAVVVSSVYDIARTLKDLDTPGKVSDLQTREELLTHASQLAQGILTGSTVDITRANFIVESLRPDVSQRVRQFFQDTEVELQSEK